MYLRCSGLLATLLMMVSYMCTYTMAGFAETPASVKVELGTPTPPCRCRHNSSEAEIYWRVNGSSSGHFPDIRSGSIDENGTEIYTLTIPSRLEYNGTKVECLAIFFDGSPTERTSPAVILFTASTSLLTTTPASTESTSTVTAPTTPVPTTSAPTTQPPPQPPSSPSSVNFTVFPSPLNVTVEQGIAVFDCQHESSDDISWRVNGTSHNSLTITKTPLRGGGFNSSLSIDTRLDFNETSVQCVAIFFQGSFLVLFSDPSLLLIQDTPGEVKNPACNRSYSSNSLTTLWDPLPTLDLTDIDPDILYTVELFRITCGQNVIMNSKIVSGNNATKEDLDLMQIYKAVITARNNVTGARNGPSVEMKEMFMSLKESLLLKIARQLEINFPSSKPVPPYYTLFLESLDGLRQDLVINITVERYQDIISMRLNEGIPSKSLWNVSILAYGCEEGMEMIELSTHDIQNVTISSPLPGQIRVTGDFVDGATATGVFFIIYSIANESDIFYSAKQAEQNSTSINVTGLTGSEYGVSVFSMENGLPFPGVVSLPKNITVATIVQEGIQVHQPPTSVEYKLQNISTGVCITCTFLDSSTTDCVAVVHQRISQLSSSGLMNIEASHKFSRSASGDTAYGCIDGVDLELYQVGVVGGKMIVESDIIDKESSQAGAITAVLVGVTTVATLITVIIVIVYIYLKIHARHKAWSTALEVPEVGITRPWPPNSIMNNNIESGSVNYNHYVEPAILKEEEAERPAEEQPLLNPPLPPRQGAGRVVADHTPVSSGDSPQLNHGSSDNSSSSDPQAVLIRSSKTVPPPATTEKLVYEDIQGFLNQQGQLYALPQLKSTSKEAPDDLHQVVYSKLQLPPKTRSEMSSTEPHEVQRTVPSEAPSTESNSEQAASEVLTVELLLSRLSPHTSKWLSLGKALSLGDDRLDEVFTNNETDQACLQEMLELYMMRSDLNHNWEEIETALKKMEKSSEASSGIQESQRDSSNESLMISGLTNFPSNSCANTQGVHLPESTAILDQSGDSFGVEQPDKQGSKNAEKDDSSSDDSGYNSRSPPLSELEFNNEHTSSQNEKVSGELPLLPCLLATSARHGDMTAFNSNIAIDIDATELDDYQSDLNSLTGSEATIQGGDDGGGEFNRTTEKNENKRPDKPMISLPVSSCSSTEQNLYVHTVGFLEKNDGQDNEEELCKLGPIHCQDSHDHKNYFTALRHQMGFQTVPKAIDNNAVEESSHGCTECPSSETQKLIISEKEWELAPQLSHAWNCLGVNQGSVSSSLSLNQNSKCRSEEDSLSYQSSGIVPALKCSNRSIIPLAVEAFDYLQSQEHDEHPTSSNKLQTFADSSHTVFDSDVITIICTGVYSKYSPQWQNSLITIHLPSDHLIILFLLAYVMLCIPYLSKSFVTTNVCSGNVCTH